MDSKKWTSSQKTVQHSRRSLYLNSIWIPRGLCIKRMAQNGNENVNLEMKRIIFYSRVCQNIMNYVFWSNRKDIVLPLYLTNKYGHA